MTRKKKKYKVEYSEQVKGCIDGLLAKGDKEGFIALTTAFKKIQEDPAGTGIRIITEHDKTLLQKLALYQGKKICGMGVWNYEGESVFKQGRDIDFEIEDTLVELFGATATNPENLPISIEAIAKLRKEGLYFKSIDFKQKYEIKLNHNSGDYLINAVGISIELKRKGLFSYQEEKNTVKKDGNQ